MAADDTQREMRAHTRTYALFVTLIKYGTLGSAAIALIVVLLIAN